MYSPLAAGNVTTNRLRERYDDDDLKEYDLEHYDDEGAGETDEERAGSIMRNIDEVLYHKSNHDDPYLTGRAEDDEEEEQEELQILATDNLILSAKVEDEIAHLEVYVYEDESDNLYVHHDIMLPAIPLALEWLDLPANLSDTNTRGNTVAIGSMDPDIEIWDLDSVDCIYPNAVLGERNVTMAGMAEEATDKKNKKKKKKRKRSLVPNDAYHVDAVLSLAANRQHRNLMASASADKTVKLWDLNTAKCAKSYSYHTDKVCSLAWHQTESTVLLSGSYDRTIVAADMRAPAANPPRWGVESDVEMVRWDPHDANYLYVSTEAGCVHCHDVRNASPNPAAARAVWTLQAHDEAVSSFDINPIIPGFLVTGSTDRTVKLWNIQPGGQGPSMVISRNLDVGKVFATTFAPDNEVGFRLAVAGSNGKLQVWDTSTNPFVRQVFAQRLPALPDGAVEDRLVGLQEKDDEDEDEDEGEGDGEGKGDNYDYMAAEYENDDLIEEY